MSKQFDFKKIQFHISMQFKCKYTVQLSKSFLFQAIRSVFLFDSQVLPLQARVDLGATAMKGYSTFLKALALLEPHHQSV